MDLTENEKDSAAVTKSVSAFKPTPFLPGRTSTEMQVLSADMSMLSGDRSSVNRTGRNSNTAKGRSFAADTSPIDSSNKVIRI